MLIGNLVYSVAETFALSALIYGVIIMILAYVFSFLISRKEGRIAKFGIIVISVFSILYWIIASHILISL